MESIVFIWIKFHMEIIHCYKWYLKIQVDYQRTRTWYDDNRDLKNSAQNIMLESDKLDSIPLSYDLTSIAVTAV